MGGAGQSRDAHAGAGIAHGVLYVDIGNSALKWNTDATADAEPMRVPLGDDFAVRLHATWQALARPVAVVFCSVATSADEAVMMQTCARMWEVVPQRVVAMAHGHGIRNRYRHPQQLGGDRWAALVAARALGKLPAVVVDCGTAWTVDALDGDGVFVGGLILASPQLTADALRHRAPGIASESDTTMETTASAQVQPLQQAESSTPSAIPTMTTVYGRSTTEAVQAGALFGALGGVAHALACFARDFGEVPCYYLCGGGAPLLLQHSTVEFVHRPGLVLHGLCLSMRDVPRFSE